MLHSVTPTEDLFSITWNLGPRCNFECSYCPPRLHDKHSPAKSLEYLQQTWNDIIDKTAHRNKRYKIALTGGEPTINPDFVDFLTWLRQDDRVANLGFTTNGSASKSKYLQAIEACDWIAFSSHHEFMNVKKFQENVLATHIYAVKKRKLVWVNLMKEDASQDSVTELESWCEKHRVRYSIQKIHWGDDAQERRKLQL